MKSNVVILSLLALIVTACSFTAANPDSPPDWVYGQSKKYASSLYLSGQGSGQTQNDAKDRARSDLAKQFEIAVKERSQQSQIFTSEQADGETQQSLNQKISRQLLTFTSHNLKGVEIVDQWYDPKNGLHYALAVLSRNKSRYQFEQKLQSLDQHSRQRLLQAEAESSLLTRAALIQQAINSQQQRLVVQSYLQVVDPSGRGIPPSLSMGELLRSRDTLLKEIHIQPVATGDMSSELVKILSGATAGAGFAIANTNNVDYELKVRTLLDPVFEKDGWYWVRGTMQIDLIDTEGNNIGVQRWPLKISSTNINRTQQRLLSDVDRLVKEELREVLLGFAMKI
jgi:hypothetical protein